MNENHVLSDSSLCAVGSWIMNESQCECELRPHSSLCESWQSHFRLACLRLSSTELRKEQMSSWRDSVHFLHSKDLFVQTTHTRPTQHYRECVWKFVEAKTALNECYWQEHISSLKWYTHMQSGLWYANIILDRKTKHENKYRREKNFIPALLQLLHAILMSCLIVDKNKPSKLNQLKTV